MLKHRDFLLAQKSPEYESKTGDPELNAIGLTTMIAAKEEKA
jgi:hypothetical protein